MSYKRRTVLLGLSFLAGMGAVIWAGGVVWLWCALCLAALGYCFSRKKQALRRQALAAAFCLCLGGAHALGFGLLVEQPVLAHQQAPQHYTGTVQQLRLHDRGMATYTLQGHFADGTAAKISCYTEENAAQIGSRMAIEGTFAPAQDDYLYKNHRTDRARGIFLRMKTAQSITVMPAEGFSLRHSLQQLRTRISTQLRRSCGTDCGGYAACVLLGEREGTPDEVTDLFTRTGMRHVLAVSGLHLTLLLSAWTWCTKRLRLPLYAAYTGTILFILTYACLVQTPVSVLRAGFMFMILHTAPLIHRTPDTPTALVIAALLLALPNPYALTDPSYLLSVSGTFGAAIFAPYMTRALSKRHYPPPVIGAAGAACISVCTFPVMLIFFDYVPLSAPAANMLILPIASLMLLLCIPILFTGGAAPVVQVLSYPLRLLYRLMLVMSYGLERLLPLRFPTGWRILIPATLLLTAAVILSYCFWKRRRAVAVTLTAAFLLLGAGQCLHQIITDRTLTVERFRQDGLVIVRQYGSTYVFDLDGDKHNSDYTLKYLDSIGENQIDLLILSRNALQMSLRYEDAMDGCIGEMVETDTFTLHIPEAQISLRAGRLEIIQDRLPPAETTAP